jgi:hypothetical protein
MDVLFLPASVIVQTYLGYEFSAKSIAYLVYICGYGTGTDDVTIDLLGCVLGYRLRLLNNTVCIYLLHRLFPTVYELP